MCILDIKSLILAKKIFGGSSSGGNTEPTIRGEREITDDWATIKAHSDNGTAQDVYQVGDYKYVNWTCKGDTARLKFTIVGFDVLPDENEVKKGIAFMQTCAFPWVGNDKWTYPLTSLFNSNIPSELVGVIGKIKINDWSAQSKTFTKLSNYYCCYPDATNLLENFTTVIGTTYTMYSGTKMDTVFASGEFNFDTDDVFPIFKGKTFYEVLSIMGGTPWLEICTRGGISAGGSSQKKIKIGLRNFELNDYEMKNHTCLYPFCIRV
jgi:hypothetical protein